MGLDIYKYTVLKKEDGENLARNEEFFELPYREKNKHMIGLFNHFKDYVFKKEYVVFNEEAFESKYLNGCGYIDFFSVPEWNISLPEDFEPDGYILVRDDDSSVFISKKEYDSFWVSVKLDTLLVASEYLQRKGMSKEFYSEFLSGCWYITDSKNDKDDSPNVVYTNDMLNEAKKYCIDDEYPIASLVLAENEFLYFCY